MMFLVSDVHPFADGNGRLVSGQLIFVDMSPGMRI